MKKTTIAYHLGSNRRILRPKLSISMYALSTYCYLGSAGTMTSCWLYVSVLSVSFYHGGDGSHISKRHLCTHTHEQRHGGG